MEDEVHLGLAVVLDHERNGVGDHREQHDQLQVEPGLPGSLALAPAELHGRTLRRRGPGSQARARPCDETRLRRRNQQAAVVSPEGGTGTLELEGAQAGLTEIAVVAG